MLIGTQHMQIKITTPLLTLIFVLSLFCLKNKVFASELMQFTLNRPLTITVPQNINSSTIMAGPETAYSAQIKVEGSKNEDISFTIVGASQTVKLRNANNKQLTLNGLRLIPEQSRLNNQGLILVQLGGAVHLRSNQAPGRYQGQAMLQARYTNNPNMQPENYPVRIIVNVFARIRANVLRNLDFGQIISGDIQNQVRVRASSNDTRAGCVVINGENRNNVKISYPVQTVMKNRSNSLAVTVSSSIDGQGKVLQLNNRGRGQICFGGVLTVPEHTAPGKYRGNIDVQMFYP
ncbi:hypothetical protein Psal006b_01615 [Piscirickettsia salmonis]|uniref:Uncharacterized protein n=2 Tax=Piscirickettsia salmonis TaxID=1238 RepID=A0AAC8VHV6_PISSA|nr:hypothetical protein KU39_1593 [Piscirickettsia salmonis]QGN98622.1 hypothetical protein Psal006b_01615 [Piscirickettsia salmonis]QGO02242.1 hypothetical protein Psal008_01629 [Piscirickettsia salmonis]QGO12929.1 hypothetical protein Psal010b_01612 [Piscirickettsia salmonis]QGO19974.1 hypothetical protein Psal013_01627 [Piscirickettsia salmonis]